MMTSKMGDCVMGYENNIEYNTINRAKNHLVYEEIRKKKMSRILNCVEYNAIFRANPLIYEEI